MTPVLNGAVLAHNPRGRGFKSRPRYQEVQVRGLIARRRSAFDLGGSVVAAGFGRT
jgi:hypothetical protein